MTQFHVIDANHRRRAQIARELISHGFHAEIYEDVAEFGQAGPSCGIVLANYGYKGLLSKIADGDIAMPVVFFSEKPTTTQVVDAVSAGAIDFLEWPFAAPGLELLMSRMEMIDGRKTAELRKRADALGRVRKLSPRELEVLALIVQGGSSKSIGEDLGISHRTVEIHRANLMSKLNARSSADAVRIAVYAGVDEVRGSAPDISRRLEEAEAA